MAIVQNQLFRTPTGETYAPAQEIDRSFGRLNQRLQSEIDKETERRRINEEMFSQAYNNIGELQSELQTNYAGIMQGAVGSTVSYLRDAFTSGKRLTDPELQMELGQRVGRIKAGMGKADIVREDLANAMKLINSDPNITNKTGALSELMSMYNNPDYLISHDRLDYESVVDKYVDPQSVFSNFVKSLPTLGEGIDTYTDQNGNLIERQTLFNDLIPRDQPYNEDGSPNIQVSDEMLKNIMEGSNPRLLDQALRIANTRYSDLPTDVALRNALRDGFSSAAPIISKSKIVKSAYDIQRDAERDAMQNRTANRQDRVLDLQYERLKRQGASEQKAQREAQEYQSLYDEFIEGIETGSRATLGKYEQPGGNVRNIDWVTDRDLATQNIPSFEEWSNDRDLRVRLLEEYVPDEEIPRGLLGRWDTNSRELYDRVVEEAEKGTTGRPVGITWEVKTGTSGGQANWERTGDTWADDPSKIPNIFEQLQNLKSKVRGSTQPTPQAPEMDNELSGYVNNLQTTPENKEFLMKAIQEGATKEDIDYLLEKL